MLKTKEMAISITASNPNYKATFTPESGKGDNVYINAEIKGEDGKEFKEKFTVLQRLSAVLNKQSYDESRIIVGAKDDMILILASFHNWPILILKKAQEHYSLLCSFGQKSYFDSDDNSGAIIANELWEKRPSNIKADYFTKTLSTIFPMLDVILGFLPLETKLKIIKTKAIADSLNNAIDFYTSVSIDGQITQKHREAIYHGLIHKVKEKMLNGLDEGQELQRTYESRIALRRNDKAIFMDYEFTSPEDYKLITVILTPEDIDAFLSFGDVDKIVGAIVDEALKIVKTGRSKESIEFFENYHVIIPNVMANPSIQKLKEYIIELKKDKTVKSGLGYIDKAVAKLKDELMLVK